MEWYTPDVGKVLDYGSGKVPRQTELLRQAGYDVYAHELAENTVLGVHASPRKIFVDTAWDVVLLSNVLNVQHNVDEAARLVASILNVHKPRVLIFNLPNAPVYWVNSGGPAGRQHLLDDRLMGALLVRDYQFLTKYPYSGGVVYAIDNGQPTRVQPQVRGCLLSSVG